MVNPVAGLGGPGALHGSDAPDIRGLASGVAPRSADRAALALSALVAHRPDVRLLTVAGDMGETAAVLAGVPCAVVVDRPEVTTGVDTVRAVSELLAAGVELLLFAGGDGTARDVLTALSAPAPAVEPEPGTEPGVEPGVGIGAGAGAGAALRLPGSPFESQAEQSPGPGPTRGLAPGRGQGSAVQGPTAVLGVPTGVKVHSAVYAVHPRAAGEVAAAYLDGRAPARDCEVVDRPDPARVSARLYGYLPVPFLVRRVQHRKIGSTVEDGEDLAGIAASVDLAPGVLHVFGPGTTTRAILRGHGYDAPVTGVTAVLDHEVHPDVDARTVTALAGGAVGVRLILSPVGGQGFLLGRGNQQLLDLVPRAELTVVATEAKLAGLGGRPLLVDTGDEALDARLRGHLPVLTGWRRRTMYRLE
ncbi:ATP-NAD kinase family protein [Longispora urticae]